MEAEKELADGKGGRGRKRSSRVGRKHAIDGGPEKQMGERETLPAGGKSAASGIDTDAQLAEKLQLEEVTHGSGAYDADDEKKALLKADEALAAAIQAVEESSGARTTMTARAKTTAAGPVSN